MLQVPLAYKYVMTAAMIAFINHYAPRLNIPVDVPLKKQEIQRLRVAPPECNDRVTDYSGGILVSNYAFAFSDGFINSHWSHFTGYFTVTKLENDGMASFGVPPLESNEGGNSLMERASRMEYTITTNNVYRMATNYLVALEIDQEIFEKKNPLTVEQGVFHSNRGSVPSPLMYAYWGAPQLRDPGSNGFAFQSSAVNGELLELNVGNASTCKGLPLIRDLNKLLVIRDEEFLKYSAGERRNLLTRFSTAICSVSTDESLILFFTTNSPTQTNLPERK